MSQEDQHIIEEAYRVLNYTPQELSKELEVSESAISQWKKRGIPRDKVRIMKLLILLKEKDSILEKGMIFFASLQEMYKTQEKKPNS